MKRIDDLEFRWSTVNEKFELVRWRQYEKYKDGEPSEYCYTIAMWHKTSEGYDARFVGSRPFVYDEGIMFLWAMLEYGQRVVDAEFVLMNEWG